VNVATTLTAAPLPPDAKILDILAMARWGAARVVPHLARGLWACTYILTDDADVPTFAIDRRWRVLCNRTFAVQCHADGSLPAALVHEALHQVLRHGPRAQVFAGGVADDLGETPIAGFDYDRWNKAGDCEINARIDEVTGLTLPSCGIHAKDFGWDDGLAAEEYYLLGDAKPKKPRPGPCGCSGGSGATGSPSPGEAALPGEGEDGPQGLDETEGDLVRAMVATATIDAARTKPGSVGAGMLRWAEEQQAPPAVDWTTLAQARIKSATQARRGPTPSFARPSRRQHGALVLPVYRQTLPRIALVLDTSGSMGDKDLGMALAVVVDACATIGSVTACACDATAGEAVEVRVVDDLRDYMKGGGGTDMVAGIARAEEGSPDAIVVVTDGETPWPSKAPGVPCVVVLTRAPTYCGAPPAWAEIVQAW
jgi:predicted metal-dependent peptidase